MVEVIFKPDSHNPHLYIIESINESGIEIQPMRLTIKSHIWRPATDVYEVDDTVVVRIEIAGMRDSDFSILLNERSLIIRGVRPDNPERRAYHQMEIRFGEFMSEVELPFLVDTEKIEAVYQAGFLRIVLPRAKPHHIQIEE
ncbi:MAG: Hsp20/alpha crystallin family protein [Chloroflexi bacterium]|nr:Hsp20/alpha crystallin family protein [Chloroflexota bacterium]